MFFKSLPSEKIQKGHPCGECGKEATRLLAEFMVGGTQNGGMEEVAAFSMQKADIGGHKRPVYRDNNGQLHEVKSASDIDRWRRDNALGKPRFVEWRNPKTGEKSWVPQRVKMIADPISGEPMDAPVVREPARIVPLDGDFTMPTETKSGIPIDPNTGTPKVNPADYGAMKMRSHGKPLIDPETGKQMTMGDMWAGAHNKAHEVEKPAANLAGTRKAWLKRGDE